MATQITLPRDAEGREIPLDTKVLYDGDGNAKEVQAFDYSPVESMWRVLLLGDFILFFTYDMHLTPPDSWEKLEEDLDRAVKNDYKFGAMACAYMNRSGDMCGDCKFYDDFVKNCSDQMVKDVASRILKLMGEDE